MCGRVLSKISDWAEDHPKTVKALKYSAIALLVLTILGGALLAYMHFSGLGISKAGFVQLGHQISNFANKAWTKFIDAMKLPAHLNIGKVVGIAAGSGLVAGAAGLIGYKLVNCYRSRNDKDNQYHRLRMEEGEEPWEVVDSNRRNRPQEDARLHTSDPTCSTVTFERGRWYGQFDTIIPTVQSLDEEEGRILDTGTSNPSREPTTDKKKNLLDDLLTLDEDTLFVGEGKPLVRNPNSFGEVVDEDNLFG